MNEGSDEDLKKGDGDGEKGLGEAHLKGFGPEPFKGLLNASERNGAEDGPLEGAEVGLEEAADGVENEDGEGEAGVGHGDVEGEADMGIAGEGGHGIGIGGKRRFGFLRVGAGLAD